MRLENAMTGWKMTVVLWLAIAISLLVPCVAQHSEFRPAQGRPPGQFGAPHPGHAGEWLRRYSTLPPGQRERMLQNDPGFRRLSPERQAMLRQRLERFSSLPPQQQQHVLNRMETWEHLTPGQKAEARDLFGRMRQLPPERRDMLRSAVRELSSMPPEQRERIIDSPRFQSMFSPQERDMMRRAARLPLAPPENRPPQ
jgi:Protein of unknown function (DUF3106)